MKREILTKAKSLSWAINREKTDSMPFASLCEVLGDLTDSNVYLLDKEGNLLGGHCNTLETAFYNERKPNKKKCSTKNSIGINQKGWQEKLLAEYQIDCNTKNNFRASIPINGVNSDVGNLFISRYSIPFGDEDMVLAEFSAVIVSIKMQNIIDQKKDNTNWTTGIVDTAMSSLSYSERVGTRMIFDDLTGLDGVVVVSRVAERAQMARTVIVNAIRKIESAGIIESKSLGMKGTYIRVLNKNILAYYKKLPVIE
jgi:transcriptional pleiotropic repressor